MNRYELREHYAGLAMQVILGGKEHGIVDLLSGMAAQNHLTPSDQVAKMSFEMADAMMRQIENNPCRPSLTRRFTAETFTDHDARPDLSEL